MSRSFATAQDDIGKVTWQFNEQMIMQNGQVDRGINNPPKVDGFQINQSTHGEHIILVESFLNYGITLGDR